MRLTASLAAHDRRVWALVATQMITAAGFSICLPFLSLHLHVERGLSMSAVGGLLLVASLAAALARLVGGELADRWGRRPILLFAVATRVLALVGMAALIHLEGPILSIAAAYGFIRLTGALAMPSISAMISDLTQPDRRTEAYGLLRVGANVGWSAGPAVGGLLAAVVPYAGLFLIASLFAIGSFALIALLVPEPPQTARATRTAASLLAALGDRQFTAFVGLALVLLVVSGQLVSTLSVFTVNRAGFSEAQFGGLLTLNGLLVVFLQYPLARRIARLSTRNALVFGGLLYATGYLAFGWLGSYLGFLAAITVVTFGEMVFSPMALRLVADLAPPGQRGRYMGAYGLAEALGWSVGPFVGGVLLDLFPASPPALWGAVAALAVLAAIGFARWGHTWTEGQAISTGS